VEHPEQELEQKLGRPKTGKRSDPEYRQVSAWIRRNTYAKVTDKLFLRENRREFSDLIQSLLEVWLKGPSKKK
jgi:hypothetical protein